MKIAIVTGARRGIGLGITRLLAGNGYRVVMCAASPAEAAEETVSALWPKASRWNTFPATYPKTKTAAPS